ncbi:MAG: hypothetical protein DWI26_04385, partial [Planctomycetota bacterium]
GRPSTGKRTLGNSLFILVPFPAAITMAVAPPEKPVLPDELAAESIFAAESLFSNGFMVAWGSVKPVIRVFKGIEVECSRKIKAPPGTDILP